MASPTFSVSHQSVKSIKFVCAIRYNILANHLQIRTKTKIIKIYAIGNQ